MSSTRTTERPSFRDFYQDHYLFEHRHPANVALHLTGTFAGLALIGASLTLIPLAWSLLFPIVHAAPGLVGHLLFERNADIGDIRLGRKDFPLQWFIAANHRLAWEVILRR